MKLKHISLVERYLERVILAVAGVFFVVVVWLYFWRGPYNVQVPNQPTTSAPEDIEQAIKDEARIVRGGLNSSSSNLPAMPVPEYAQAFQRAMIRRVVNVERFDLPLGEPGLDQSDTRLKNSQPPPTHFYVPPPPAPRMVRSQAGHFVLANIPSDTQLAMDWVSEIGPQVPRDFRDVTIWTNYDVDAMAERYRAVPEGQRIPEEWWRNLLLICDVVLEREALDPATGQWGDLTTIKPLPNALSFRDQPPDQAPLAADQDKRTIRDRQDDIARPALSPMDPETPWTAPGSADLGRDEQSGNLRDLQDAISRVQQQIDALKARAGNAPPVPIPAGPGAGPASTRGGGRFIGPGRGTAQPGPGPAGRYATGGAQPGAANNNDLAQLQDRKAKLQQQLAKARNLSQPPISNPDAPTGMGLGQPIWAHDVTARPGMTYRYRLSVGLFNPLFHRPELDAAQRPTYFNKLYVLSEPSPWSAPVKIDQDSYFYVVGANKSDDNATVEVYHIFNGHWRPMKFNVTPGDMIGKLKKLPVGNTTYNVDFRIDATVVDVDFGVPANKGMNATTAGLLLLDNRTGKLLLRTVDEDLDDLTRQRLHGEAGAAATPVARAPDQSLP